MTLLTTIGFDVYVERDETDIFWGCFKSAIDVVERYEGIIQFRDKSLKEITINFPLYNDIDEVAVGLRSGARLLGHRDYKISKPVLFYGSSITQGACASRPGLCYEAWISRRLDCDYINFGFAGSCKGEEAIVDYMTTLNISAFVCDYDHNAPSPKHLQNTHKRVYTKMRHAHKDIPIILISRPNIDFYTHDQIRRRNIVHDTYLEGLKKGDTNLWYIDGYSLFFGADREECTVDGCHPNDIGFYRMADVIGKTLELAINNYQKGE